MQTAFNFSAPAAPDPRSLPDHCPCCGTDWVEELAYGSLYGLRVVANDADQFVVWQPCCLDMRSEVEHFGFTVSMGASVEQVVNYLAATLGIEVLEISEDFDANVLARLTVKNPTEPKLTAPELAKVRRQIGPTAPKTARKLDRNGNAKAGAPKGWQAEIFEDVAQHHSHHERPNGWKFGVAVYNGLVKVGVMVVGTPSARALMQAQPHTAEVTRGCILPVRGDLRKNAATKLYAAACEQAKALGYARMVTYTMAEESGHSLIAAGWTMTGRGKGGSWDKPSRARAERNSKTDITGEKLRWEKGLTKAAKKLVAAAAI